MATNTVKLDTTNRSNARAQRIQDFFVHSFIQPRTLSKAYPGVMHFLIFWGMTIQVVGTIINLMQMQLFIPFVELQFPRGNLYLAYELVMDLAGVAILAGVLMALFRRLVLRPKTLETRWDDVYALVLLTVIPVVGFTTEGLRLLATSPAWSNWSPVGNLTASLFGWMGVTPDQAAASHASIYWVHMIAGLVLAASIPFTKLRHLFIAPANIVLRSLSRPSVLTAIEDIEEAEKLGAEHVADFTTQQLLSFDACVRCGRCEELCPVANAGMPFSPRAFVQALRGEMADTLFSANGTQPTKSLVEALGQESPWYCTTCGACLSNCPVFVDPVPEIIEMRRYQSLMTGSMPGSVGLALRNIERQNNPWGLPAADRMAWAEGLDIPVLNPGDSTDVLLFVGCAMAYDDRNKQVGKALVELLKSTGVDFAIMGDAEMCCGETARRLGNEYTFQVLAQENIAALNELDFKRIAAPCPHCLNTLKNEYPQFGGNYEVIHYTELLSDVVPSKRGTAKNGSRRVAYHDSCYLGRYNDIYSQPRDLLKGADVELVELPLCRQNAMCCGGGGGQMWMETDAETRVNQLRLQGALSVDADVIATACPYCLLMFDDAIRSRGIGDQVAVMDITEILTEV